MILLYDGSFETFLTLVHEVYYKKLQPDAIVNQAPQTLLFESLYEVRYDEAKSLAVFEALQKRFTKENFERILHIFMCDGVSFEMDLLHYIITGFKSQRELQNITLAPILRLHTLQKELFHVYHKMSGFLRFSELEDGMLYAKLEAKYSILYFLGMHFSKRLSNQNYIIHDIQRSLAFIHTKEFKGVQKVAAFEAPELSDAEQKFSKLWKTFFESVAIKSRENKKLQKRTVPLLYRTYMTEFMNE